MDKIHGHRLSNAEKVECPRLFPHTAIAPMFHELDQHTKRILSAILVATESVRDGLDALKYRAEHFDQSDILDQLQGVGYLRRENDKYWVSLTALPQLDDDKAKQLLKYCDNIFAEIKTYYRENQRDQLKLTDLAKRAVLDLVDVQECLSYMVEGSWWGGHTDFFSTDDPYIKPSEAILKYSNFHDVINQLREWQHYRIEDRDRFITMQPNIRGDSSEEKTRRERPDWFQKLPSKFQTLLGEVYQSQEMQALSSMGLRTVIDMACNDLVGDIGGLSQKLTALKEKGHINSNERAVLEIAVNVGNASAHRGHNPTAEDLNTLLDIVEHLLQGIYVLRDAAEQLRKKTPPRSISIHPKPRSDKAPPKSGHDLPSIKGKTSTVFFSKRFAKAFPGVRGIEWFRKPVDAIRRLRILFTKPFVFREAQPIWWWRSGDMYIQDFSMLSEDTVLLDQQEITIDELAAVNAGSYYQKFLYIKAKPSPPSGLFNNAHILDQVALRGYAREEFALFRGRPVTRAEYDDGAAVIDDTVVDLNGEALLRERFLTPYNFIIAPHESPINNNHFDQLRDDLLNQILRGETTVETLTDAVLKLPRREYYNTN